MADKEAIEVSMETEREVLRCQVCGLVQYRTQHGQLSPVLRMLFPKVTLVIPTPSAQDLPGDDRQLFENWPNRETVENIGQRIRQLRESRGMTQSQLQARSRVSRSYLSRIESGQMTPSLGTLEKIAEALGVGLNRFFVPETNGETVLEDPFIQGLRPYLRQLDWTQWQGILKRLQAISEHVSTSHTVRPMTPQVATGCHTTCPADNRPRAQRWRSTASSRRNYRRGKTESGRNWGWPGKSANYAGGLPGLTHNASNLGLTSGAENLLTLWEILGTNSIISSRPGLGLDSFA